MKVRFKVLILSLILLLSVLAAVFIFISQKEKNPIVLTYWTHDDKSREELELKLIEEFESLHSDIRIERVVHTSSEHFSIIPAAFDVGFGPDIFSIIQTSLDPMIRDGSLAEYPKPKSEVSADYIDGVLEGATYDGVLYGLPMEYTNWALYLNMDVIEKAGIDINDYDLSTWEGIKALSMVLVEREDGILTKRGFDFRYPYYLNFFIPMVNQLGGGIEERDGRLYLINEDAWKTVFEFFRDWGPLGDNLGSPTYINARSVFPKGESAMMLSGLYNEERFRSEYPEFYSSGKWVVLPFPVFDDSVNSVASAKYCHYWCVNSSLDSRKKEAAWSFIEFLSDHYKDYVEDVRLLLPRKEIAGSLYGNAIPYLDVFLSDLDRSNFIYTGSSSEELRSILEECVKNVMLGGEDCSVSVERLKIALANLPL